MDIGFLPEPGRRTRFKTTFSELEVNPYAALAICNALQLRYEIDVLAPVMVRLAHVGFFR